MLTSDDTIANLDQWVENGFINIEQREAFAQLIEVATQDAYEDGLSQSDNDGGYDDGYSDGVDSGYDSGYEDGERAAKAEWETQRDEWFEQGWAECLIEHGIEE